MSGLYETRIRQWADSRCVLSDALIKIAQDADREIARLQSLYGEPCSNCNGTGGSIGYDIYACDSCGGSGSK